MTLCSLDDTQIRVLCSYSMHTMRDKNLVYKCLAYSRFDVSWSRPLSE